LYFFQDTCQVCPSGYDGSTSSGNCEVTSSSGNGTTTIINTSDTVQYAVIYFPFIIIALFFVIVALSGKFKDSSSQVLAVIISFWGIVEFFLYITLGILAFRDHDLVSVMAV
jgi:hypothetical protein